MSKEDELAKELVEVVPNTYGDLHDAPVEYIEILSSGKVEIGRASCRERV